MRWFVDGSLYHLERLDRSWFEGNRNQRAVAHC